MGSLFLIRHGQASYGEADYDRLSARGHEQAKTLGPWMAAAKLDALYAGPLRRQRETAANMVEGTAVSPVELAGLAEYPAFEMLQHLMPRLVKEDPKFAQLSSAPTPRLLDDAFKTVLAKWASDEWGTDAVERITAFVDRVRGALYQAIAEAKSGARIACVTSAGPIGVGVGLAFGITAAQMVRTSIVIRNASITELKFRSGIVSPTTALSPDHISLVTFNVTGHMPAELQTER
ncbi:histidine phosphatase family protein [soil metagenome]